MDKLVVALLCLTAAKAYGGGRMELVVGGRHQLALTEPSDISLSRKGVVDVKPDSLTSWEIIGLRPGVVRLSWTAGGDKQEHLYIVVVSLAHQAKRDKRFPLDLCQQSGVSCDAKAGVMRGDMDRWRRWLWLRRRCQMATHCDFQVALSKLGMKRFARALEMSLGRGVDVKASSLGGLRVWVNCGELSRKDLVDMLVPMLGSHKNNRSVDLRCMRERPIFASYLLRARVIALRHHKDKARGLAWDPQAVREPQGVALDGSIRPQSRASQQNSRILAEPSLVVTEGQAFSLHSGSEFLTVYGEDSPKLAWKKVGVLLEGTVVPQVGGKVLLSYELFLKSRGGHHALDGSQASSSAFLKLNHAARVVSTDIFVDQNGHTSSLSLHGIPILGPLLRLYTKNHVKQTLQLWVHITPALVDRIGERIKWPDESL